MTKAEVNEVYKVKFTDYPDIVGITDLQSMLRISIHSAYAHIGDGYLSSVKVAIPSKPASELTGMTVGTLNRHVANGNLIGAVIAGKMLVSKRSLIGHLSSPETVRKAVPLLFSKRKRHLLQGARVLSQTIDLILQICKEFPGVCAIHLYVVELKRNWQVIS